MRQSSARLAKWLLFSDIHFKHRELDRIQQTAQWIASIPRQQDIQRVVICGDLLTSRTAERTDVLSACYRFINDLSVAVPRINIILGNHDFARKHDYQTTALDALNLQRLLPYVSVHGDVATDTWDGRRVLLLPFREDQSVLVDAVAALDAKTARETVAFAHLAIHKAITQRHVAGSSSSLTYRGLTGPDRFASLARTFTGHFHSHQVISNGDQLQGSVVYLGSPLQLTWGDLFDNQRGVVLFDPDTLQHELVVSPHAVAYMAVEADQVLNGKLDFRTVQGKHVRLMGHLTRIQYVSAREILLENGARTVPEWIPPGLTLQENHHSLQSLGKSVPESDMKLQTTEVMHAARRISSKPFSAPQAQAPQLDLMAEMQAYLASLKLDGTLAPRRHALVDAGQRILQIAHQAIEGTRDYAEIRHEVLQTTPRVSTDTVAATRLPSPKPPLQPGHVFVARPRTLVITNFLGIQGSLKLEFGSDLQRGVTFLVGENGSGKSTLVEAMTWCQFGACIRSGTLVNDVINDVVRKNCSVSLEFDNGYRITRYRKDSVYGDGVTVSLHGQLQSQFQHANIRDTQAAIDELLGTDCEAFVRTVVLSHESTASFLSSKPTQRRDLIESALELSILDECGQMCRQILKEIEKDVAEVQKQSDVLVQMARFSQNRLHEHQTTQARVVRERDALTASLGTLPQELSRLQESLQREEDAVTAMDRELESKLDSVQSRMASLDEEFDTARQKSYDLFGQVKLGNSCAALHAKEADLDSRIRKDETKLDRLTSSLASLREQNMPEKTEPPKPSWLLLQVRGSVGALKSVQQRLRAYLQTPALGWAAKLARTGAVNPCLVVVGHFLRPLQNLEIAMSGQKERDAERLRLEAYQKLARDLEQDISDARDGIAELSSLRKRDSLIKSICGSQNVREEDLRTALEAEPQDVQVKQKELDRVMQLQASLQLDREKLQREQRELAQQQKPLQRKHETLDKKRKDIERKAQSGTYLKQQVAEKEKESGIYKKLMENEELSLAGLRAKKEKQTAERSRLSAEQEVIAFWTSMLTKRAGGTALSAGKKQARAPTFREHLLGKSLRELNGIMAEVLTTLFGNTRHAKEMTTGMLRSVFSDGGEDDETRVLDETLKISSELAYGKRSSGERKRMDLALFFALLRLNQARSPYRAHYLLVDESFDSLDVAGQAAVVRWCQLMSTSVDFILVITHSPHLVTLGIDSLDEGEATSGQYAVIRAKMGKNGTQLELGSQTKIK